MVYGRLKEVSRNGSSALTYHGAADTYAALTHVRLVLGSVHTGLTTLILTASSGGWYC